MIDCGALFDKVYNEYYYKIVAYFRRRVKYDRDAAEDLAQQTFFKLWTYMLQNGGKVVNVRAFLYAIAKNVRADYYRRSRDYCLSTEQCVDLVKCDDPERSEDIVYAALAKLSAQDAKLIKLRIMGYSYAEISKLLGANVSTLRTRYLSAKRRLKKIINSEDEL